MNTLAVVSAVLLISACVSITWSSNVIDFEQERSKRAYAVRCTETFSTCFVNSSTPRGRRYCVMQLAQCLQRGVGDGSFVGLRRTYKEALEFCQKRLRDDHGLAQFPPHVVTTNSPGSSSCSDNGLARFPPPLVTMDSPGSLLLVSDSVVGQRPSEIHAGDYTMSRSLSGVSGISSQRSVGEPLNPMWKLGLWLPKPVWGMLRARREKQNGFT
ncbi:hypothetical protein ScPMuIL_016778 [Solemya velum]